MDDREFEEMIHSGKPVLVDFFAEWCGPCQYMKPQIEQLEHRVGDKAEVLSVDVDQQAEISMAYGIQAVPTIILFKNGEVVWRQSGVVSADVLENLINDAIAA